MRIYRSHPDDHFTIVPNATLRDERLTPTARGVLVELLSHSDGWATNADAMWRRIQRQRGGDQKRGTGRRAYRDAFAELEAAGYMVRRRVRDKDGTVKTELDLYDIAQHRGTANRTSVNQTSVSRTSVSGTSVRSTSQRRTDEEDGFDEHSATLDKTRVGAAHASPRDRDHELQQFYDATDKLDDQTLRNALLLLEKKRPRIYRECRDSTIDQYDAKDRSILKSVTAARRADVLSFKYALRHYRDNAEEWPAWLVRPLRSPAKRRAA